MVNPSAPWHRYLAGDGVIIRPLPATFPKGTTYLAWRVDRDVPDDLGPVLHAARVQIRLSARPLSHREQSKDAVPRSTPRLEGT